MKQSIVRVLRGSALVLTMAAVAIVGASCYPNAPEDAEEFDVVATFYDTEADFSAFTNFASRTDSIVQIEISGAENREISHEYDEDILKRINDALASRGYTREPDPSQNKPDMAILVSAAATTEYDPYASSPWFSYWGSWFSDSLGVDVDVTWGLDYSWYTGSVVYSYDVGSLVIAILDIRNVDDTTDRADIPVLWLGSFNGILSGSDVAIVKRVENAIDKMFEQSPYLRKDSQ